jgi:hypothetical protein
MEVAAFMGWVVVGVIGILCTAERVRQICLRAHTASLRDRGEYKYVELDTHT